MNRTRSFAILSVLGILSLGLCVVLTLFATLPVKPSPPATATSIPTISTRANAGLDLPRTTPTLHSPPALPSARPPSPTPALPATPLPIPSPTPEPPPPITPTPEVPVLTEAHLSRVIDGDTIDVLIAGQTVRVRLIGMDTPETNGAPICYGQEATAHTRQLIDSAAGKLWLEKDVSETDRYGRLLRYVWLTRPSGTTPGKMLNEQLLLDGYAQVATFPPDVKYIDRFLQAERAAKAAQRGLWGACERFGAALPTPTPFSSAPSATPAPPQPTAARPPTTIINDSSLPYDPHGPDRDCSDFATHAEAQRFFIAAGGPTHDPHRLDADHDGIACESLP